MEVYPTIARHLPVLQPPSTLYFRNIVDYMLGRNPIIARTVKKRPWMHIASVFRQYGTPVPSLDEVKGIIIGGIVSREASENRWSVYVVSPIMPKMPNFPSEIYFVTGDVAFALETGNNRTIYIRVLRSLSKAALVVTRTSTDTF